MQIDMYASSHVGLRRDHNEDRYLILPDDKIIAVCDGLGGHIAGEVASQMAADTLKAYFNNEIEHHPDFYSDINHELTDYLKDLIVAIRLASRRIFLTSHWNRAYTGMGTTIAAIMFKDNLACMAHVGDSRIYRLADTNLQQLTLDHTPFIDFSEKDRFSLTDPRELGISNTLSRALGVKGEVAVDLKIEKVKQDDIFLICSDGLSNMVPNRVISDILLHEQSLEKAARQLIDAANMAGGKDNITVAIARINELDEFTREFKNAGAVITIQKEIPLVQEQQDKILTHLYRDEYKEKIKTGGISRILLFMIIGVIFISSMILLNILNPKKWFSKKGPLTSMADSILTSQNIENDTATAVPLFNPDTYSKITGQLMLEVYPYSDSTAGQYDIAIDGKLVGNFSELRQSGIILQGGQHRVEVAHNGIIIYKTEMTVNDNGEEIGPLILPDITSAQNQALPTTVNPEPTLANE